MPHNALEYGRAWRKKNRERVNANARARRELNPARFKAQADRKYARFRLWLDGLKDKPCADCRTKYPPECMDFDHVVGPKLFKIGDSVGRTRETTLAEIAKCELVCANCHRIRTKERGKNGFR